MGVGIGSVRNVEKCQGAICALGKLMGSWAVPRPLFTLPGISLL